MTWYARIGMLLALLSLPGCNREVTRAVPTRPDFERSYHQGAMMVTMTVAETNIAVAGKVALTVSVQVPSASAIRFPTIDTLVDSLTVLADRDEILPSPDDGHMIKRREWVMAPSMPGTVTIPSLAIACGTDRVITDPLSIHVKSVLPPDLQDLEIRDIAGPVTELSRPRKPLWLPVAAAVLLAVAVVIFVRLKKRRGAVEPAPHEAALHALSQLSETGVARIHALNRILREYIERRFHLRMIGKTAQEILPELEQSKLLVQTPWLTDFFELGDQVRFSNVVRPGFIDEVERFVIGYIETTKPQEET